MRIYLPLDVEIPPRVTKVGQIKIGEYTADVIIKSYGDRFHEICIRIGNAEKFVTSYTRQDLARARAESIVKNPSKWIRIRGEKNE